MVTMMPTTINERWELLLPEHRHNRQEWDHWEKERLAAMRDHIQPGMTVWDIGAEEGDFPALWASWGADVFLAESNRLVWPNIRAVFDANNLTGHIVGLWVGLVGDKEIELQGAGEPRAHILRETEIPDGKLWPRCAWGPVIGDHGFVALNDGCELAAQTTIDALVAAGNPPPDVITMDIEGSELRCVIGALDTLRLHRPTLFISVHPEFMAFHYHETPEDLMGVLKALDYEVDLLAHDHEAHWRCLPR